MFSTKKFGAFISNLRKRADMTQSELADMLNLSRQAISKYEVGDSFPDISILINIAEIYNVSIDELINSGEPTRTEADILERAAKKDEEIIINDVSELLNLAPLLKPSVLDRMAQGLSKQGIDISHIVALSEYLNEESVIKLLENTSFNTINKELLEKLIPFLDEKSKVGIFEKILSGELDWSLIKIMLPYAEHLTSQIEAAVVYGAIDKEALKTLNNYWRNKNQI